MSVSSIEDSFFPRNNDSIVIAKRRGVATKNTGSNTNNANPQAQANATFSTLHSSLTLPATSNPFLQQLVAAEEEEEGDVDGSNKKRVTQPTHRRAKTDSILTSHRVKTKMYDGPSRLIEEWPSSATATSVTPPPESDDK